MIKSINQIIKETNQKDKTLKSINILNSYPYCGRFVSKVDRVMTHDPFNRSLDHLLSINRSLCKNPPFNPPKPTSKTGTVPRGKVENLGKQIDRFLRWVFEG